MQLTLIHLLLPNPFTTVSSRLRKKKDKEQRIYIYIHLHFSREPAGVEAEHQKVILLTAWGFSVVFYKRNFSQYLNGWWHLCHCGFLWVNYPSSHLQIPQRPDPAVAVWPAAPSLGHYGPQSWVCFLLPALPSIPLEVLGLQCPGPALYNSVPSKVRKPRRSTLLINLLKLTSSTKPSTSSICLFIYC